MPRPPGPSPPSDPGGRGARRRGQVEAEGPSPPPSGAGIRYSTGTRRRARALPLSDDRIPGDGSWTRETRRNEGRWFTLAPGGGRIPEAPSAPRSSGTLFPGGGGEGRALHHLPRRRTHPGAEPPHLDHDWVPTSSPSRWSPPSWATSTSGHAQARPAGREHGVPRGGGARPPRRARDAPPPGARPPGGRRRAESLRAHPHPGSGGPRGLRVKRIPGTPHPRVLLPFLWAFLRDRRRFILLGAPARRTGGAAPEACRRPHRRIASLGPTFIKLAQIFSARADLFPEPYLSRIGTLQDQVPPVPPPPPARSSRRNSGAPSSPSSRSSTRTPGGGLPRTGPPGPVPGARRWSSRSSAPGWRPWWPWTSTSPSGSSSG
jgi:hypothetical protein